MEQKFLKGRRELSQAIETELPPSLTLRTLLAIVRRQRLMFQAALVVAALLTIAFMHLVRPTYTVTLQLVPAPSATDRSGLSGTLGALAAAGLGGVGQGNELFKIYLAGLQSHAASDIIANDAQLMHRIFAEQWSRRDHVWRTHPGMLNYIAWPIKEVLGLYSAPPGPPASDAVYQYLQDKISIEETRDSPIVTVTMHDQDPRLAADFLNKLTGGVDQMMRARALRRSNDYISYLSNELKHVENSDLRATLIEHLSDQEKQKMMASANNVSYVADMFNGPAASPKPTFPKLLPTFCLMLVLCSLCGFACAMYLEAKGMALAVRKSVRGFRVITMPRTAISRAA